MKRILFSLIFTLLNFAYGDVLEFKQMVDEPRDGFTGREYQTGEWKREIYLSHTSILTSKHLVSAYYSEQNFNYHDITLVLTPEGRKALFEFSKNKENEQFLTLAIIVNDKILSAPVVHQPLDLEKISVTGDFSKDEAMKLAKTISNALKYNTKKTE